MKEKVSYLEAGYADLGSMRILVTIVFILGLIAIPGYLKYDKRSKLMPVLNDLEQSVGGYYKKNKQLPDIEEIPVTAYYEYVDIQNKQYRINLSLLDKDMAYKYLQILPYLNKGNISWKCTFVGGIYKDEIPALVDGFCPNGRLTLEARSLGDRSLDFMKRIWGVILGYVLFVCITFLVG